MWRLSLSQIDNKRIIIGFAGAKGSGKDTGYRLLNELYPDTFKRVAFADPIKNTICKMFNLTIDQLNTVKRLNDITLLDINSDNTYGYLSGRDLVREIGMLMRNYDDQQFNRYVQQTIEKDTEHSFVITDVRFENEIELVHKLHGYVIRVDRNVCKYDNHVTERLCSNPDYVIDNNKDLDYYRNQLKEIIDGIQKTNVV